MKSCQLHFYQNEWKKGFSDKGFDNNKAQLVLIFGSASVVTNQAIFTFVKETFPAAQIVSASTSGEIIGASVYNDSAVLTAIEFAKTTVKCVKTNVADHANSFETGRYLINEIQDNSLTSVFIVSDGTLINGSELVAGLNTYHTKKISITGGLAGDDAKFIQTFTGLNEVASHGNVIAIGFYGDYLKAGYGSFGGWDEFGKERTITKSDKNVLYEIDGKCALDLYKEYLGSYVEELPGSALLFPLSLKTAGFEKNLVRTILSINEDKKTMTFAGNMPEGSTVRLMKANFTKLIDASSIAADYSLVTLEEQRPQLAILISCIGRKLILQEKCFEEVEAVKNVLGNKTVITGFYSYGEIAPLNSFTNCELYNQTMTITTFAEIE
jgi:hypothetical protein